MKKFTKNSEGFTLIEIIFSIAFLSIISVIILKLMVTSFNIDNKSDLMDIASLQAINEIENAKTLVSFDEDNFESIKYYTSNWELLTSEKNSSYYVMLVISKNDLYEKGLYDIKASVVDTSNDDEIFQIETMHYYNVRE